MRTLAEILADIPEDLTGVADEDLSALRAELTAAARAAREGELTATVVADLQRAADVIGTVRVELTERATAAAELEAEADAAIAALDGSEDEEVEGDESTEGEESDGADEGTDDESADDSATIAPVVEITAPAADAPVEPAVVEVEVPVSVAAAAVPAQPRRNVRVPARNQPRPTQASPVSMVASGEMPGIAPGHQFGSLREVHEAVVQKWDTMRNVSGGDGENVHVARIDYSAEYGDRQFTGRESLDELASMVAAASTPESLTAAGICGPPEPRYDLITYGQTLRPVRGALPSFLARRGQIIFPTAPTLADIVIDTTGGAIDSVTAAQDAAGSETKTVQTIACASTTTVSVRAKTLQFKVNNFSDRFTPELLPAYVGLGQVAFARQQEAAVLNAIKTGSTKWTDTPAKYGAFRDLKALILGTVEWYRDTLRDDSVTLMALIPDFVPAMLVTDLVRQQPGDSAWSASVAQMRAEIASWGVSPVFTDDSIRGAQLTTPSGQSPRTPGFDADVEMAIFPSGTWLYLDGGTLDLGTVRDSTLNAANQFQTFYESWEEVAKLGAYSHWITASLCAGGDSQVATDIAVCSPQGS